MLNTPGLIIVIIYWLYCKTGIGLLSCLCQIPEFNGLATLKIVKQRNKDLPFLVVFGTIGE